MICFIIFLNSRDGSLIIHYFLIKKKNLKLKLDRSGFNPVYSGMETPKTPKILKGSNQWKKSARVLIELAPIKGLMIAMGLASRNNG